MTKGDLSSQEEEETTAQGVWRATCPHPLVLSEALPGQLDYSSEDVEGAMISTVVPLKKDALVALDSGQVMHIGGACILVWDEGKVVRWGLQTYCARGIESTRFARVGDQPRAPCYTCARQYCISPVPRQRVWADWFDLFGIRYRAAGIGVFVRR